MHTDAMYANETSPQPTAGAAVDVVDDEELAKKQRASNQLLLSNLAAQFKVEFTEAKSQRTMMERRWIDDLRAYKGMYDSATEAELKTKGRSRLFMRLVRSKVKTMVARLADVLFPAGDKNWSIAPTPAPEIDKEAFAQEIAAIMQRDGQMDEEAMTTAINEVAREKCEAMSVEIDDQLKELDYEGKARRVIFSATLYGTGVLKGPLGSPKKSKRWKQVDNVWQQSYKSDNKPYCREIPLWYYYPDPTATEVKDCRYEFEYMPMTMGEVTALKQDDRFDSNKIKQYLDSNPTGSNSIFESWETDVRALSKDQASQQPRPDRYIMLCRWGRVSGHALVASGIEVEDPHAEYESQAWMLGDVIVRLDINPFESGSRPFKLFYFDKDESSIWGEGLPSIMSDTMRGVNTSIRAAIDNAAASAVPNMEVNTQLLAPDEADTDTFTNGRVWRRTGKGSDSQYPAIRIIDVPTKVQEFTGLMKLFMEMSDEVTNIPRYSGGSANGNEVAKTVGGLSMLMGQANIGVKELAKQWDDGITNPFISDLYAWNMQFSEKASIKGDYEVVARGASSLVAKEIRSNALGSYVDRMLAQAPELAKKRELFAEIARSLDINPDEVMKSKEQVDSENVEKQTSAAAMETVQKIAQAMGMKPEAVVQNIDQLTQRLAQMVQGQNQ